MKKIMLLSSFLLLGVSAYAYPGVDMTVGGAPFAVIQETMFEKEEYDLFQEEKDDQGRPVIKRSNSVRGRNDRCNVNDLKQPANVDLNSYFEHKNDYTDPADMEVTEKGGKLLIKPAK